LAAVICNGKWQVMVGWLFFITISMAQQGWYHKFQRFQKCLLAMMATSVTGLLLMTALGSRVDPRLTIDFTEVLI
jgi:hypothetical protein